MFRAPSALCRKEVDNNLYSFSEKSLIALVYGGFAEQMRRIFKMASEMFLDFRIATLSVHKSFGVGKGAENTSLNTTCKKNKAEKYSALSVLFTALS